ncbi:MAG TPA: gamma-glutamyl-gamma-aminobutyrate hydrolase family protein, partial [Myxococcales bacterium]|nr:gamma-glutamyl-gamma-aminobutyrate hydrolase family protein [Myxococcales bacterium]
MSIPRLVIVQTGTAAPEIVRQHGDYPDWFNQALGAELPVLRAHLGERLELPAGTQGVLVSGSPLSLTRPEPWMDEVAEELLRIGERGTPVLGVCFGHQLLGRAAGSQVVRNPKGREIGTVRVQLTAAGRTDPLFRGWVPDEGLADVQATHVDSVDPVPSGATLLASNERCATQALRLSDAVASVQFHPELRPETLRDLIDSRAGALRAEGLDPDSLRADVRETASARLLRAFADEA